jgi:phosphomannomutase
MTNDLLTRLDQALNQKLLNQTAHDELVKWLSDPEFKEFVPELKARVKRGDWEALMDAFYRVVIFGTGGIRGVMDLGTNRINNYTIRWASQAYANYLHKHQKEVASKGVAIAYDSRLNSERFMKETARVLAANNIPVRIFKYYRATPELSFAVRYLGLAGGIVITASHNPPEFNGYKLYDAAGVQVLPELGLKIEAEFKAIKTISKLPFDEALAKGLITYIDDEVDAAFAESARAVSVSSNRDVHIVYSPLHGVGSQSVLPVLKAIGFEHITVVAEQESLDGHFPNVEGHFPNPEFAVVYKEAIALAKKVRADIVIVSDPDADRLGVAVPDKQGNWRNLNGNEGAVLMGYYYLNALKEAGKLPKKPVVIKTSVTTELVRDVAEGFGAEVIGDLLVGFKFIGDRQEYLPPDKQFMFGCEESVGYLFTNAYRDKGAETPAVVAAELGAWCKAQSTTPLELLETIYQTYGYYAERLFYRLIEGFGSFDRMNLAMQRLRQELPKTIANRRVVKIIDRLTGEVRDGQSGRLLETRNWDKGDMLSFFLSDDERSVIHVRPSGTEPKMKYYTMLKGQLNETSKTELDEEAKILEHTVVKIFEDILDEVEVDVFKT